MISEKKIHKYKVQHIHITSIISMALVLFLVGLLSLILFMARDISIHVKENINLSVILDDNTNDTVVAKIKNYLETSTYTKSVVYISKEDALKDHIATLGEDPKAFLGYNPLLASFEVKLKAEYANNDSVKIIESKLSTFEDINRIAYLKDMVNLVNENVRKISIVLLGIAIVLLIISLVLINNTVRVAVYSNRFLINTMKLVGATPWFIRKPYIYRGMLNGIIAAIISIFLLAGTIYYIQFEFGIKELMITPLTALFVILIVIFLGLSLTAISSYFAVGRFLKMKTDQIYSI
ncbi:MAG TPA: permease-like cell division protein FtsX [Paludibacter sp.]|nr:permease-like cell division protein FtsX [Paludibacter sp.]